MKLLRVGFRCYGRIRYRSWLGGVYLSGGVLRIRNSRSNEARECVEVFRLNRRLDCWKDDREVEVMYDAKDLLPYLDLLELQINDIISDLRVYHQIKEVQIQIEIEKNRDSPMCLAARALLFSTGSKLQILHLKWNNNNSFEEQSRRGKDEERERNEGLKEETAEDTSSNFGYRLAYRT